MYKNQVYRIVPGNICSFFLLAVAMINIAVPNRTITKTRLRLGQISPSQYSIYELHII